MYQLRVYKHDSVLSIKETWIYEISLHAINI